MRLPFRDVAMDAMVEELDNLKVRLSIVEDPELPAREDADSLRNAISHIEQQIAERRRLTRH